MSANALFFLPEPRLFRSRPSSAGELAGYLDDNKSAVSLEHHEAEVKDGLLPGLEIG